MRQAKRERPAPRKVPTGYTEAVGQLYARANLSSPKRSLPVSRTAKEIRLEAARRDER